MQIGDEFGRLEVLEVLPKGRVRVRCECGAEKEVLKRNLKGGDSRSCGCLARETSRTTINRLRTAYQASKAEGAR